MATKTISLEVDAYEKLRRARRSPGESFSSVVRRARWDNALPDGPHLLEDLTALCALHPEILLPRPDLAAMAKRRRTVRHRTPWQG